MATPLSIERFWKPAAVVGVVFLAGFGLRELWESRVQSTVLELLRHPPADVRALVSSAVPTDGPPVGSVLPYWGALEESNQRVLLPESMRSTYELCDGNVVSTNGSPIIGVRKPDLRGRGIKGADAAQMQLFAGTELPTITGGQDTINLSHWHSSGSLVAEMQFIGGWLHWNTRDVNSNENYALGRGDSGDVRPTGDRRKTTGVSVAGVTDSELGVVDNSPPYQVLVFVIRVR